MVLDTMTLEELIREIKTDFSEVKGRWKNYVRKFRKTAQKRTMFPWLWEANIKTRRFNFLCRVEKRGWYFESHIHNVIQV